MLERSKFTCERPREGGDPLKSVRSAFSSAFRLTLPQNWKLTIAPHFWPTLNEKMEI